MKKWNFMIREKWKSGFSRVVSNYCNLIYRNNINNYYLCKVSSFREKNLTKDEIENCVNAGLRASRFHRDLENR
jgi:hypothetical protein